MADGTVRYAVEIESLTDFLAFVDRELTATLEPGSSGIRVQLPAGQRWGGTVQGRVVRAARVAYLGAHGNATDNLASYAEAGATMLEVIKRLMDTYRTSEELAKVRTEDVLRLFDAVSRERSFVRSVPQVA
jgi:hypothetical protein